MQEIGTRIYYGEPVTGLGIGFDTKDRYKEFLAYVDYQAACLRNESSPTDEPVEIEVPFNMNLSSLNKFITDLGGAEALRTVADKEVTLLTEHGVKLVITIKHG